MPVKLRLARHGRKSKPFYHIVAADSRAPRDGRFIEQVGSYNPNTNPATIDLNFDRALDWLEKGAQPTDTVRAILSHEGVLMKRHLLKGAQKGAFELDQVEVKYAAWKQSKADKIQAKVDGLANKAVEDAKARLVAETAVSQKRAEEIAKRIADAAAAETASEEAEAADDAEGAEA